MSLINEALKRAQRQRTGDSPPLATMPGVGGESAARIAKRARPVGFNSMLLRLGLGAGAVLVLVVGGIFALQALKSRPSAPPPAKPAVVVADTPAKPAEPAPAKPIASSPANTFVLPLAAPPAAAPVKPPPPVVSESKPVITTPVATPPAPAPVKPAAALPTKLEPKAMSFIENLHVAGIRASTTDSKVLMNDRVYRVGDTVEHELGLKLTGITSSSLTFEDERGARYTRSF